LKIDYRTLDIFPATRLCQSGEGWCTEEIIVAPVQDSHQYSALFFPILRPFPGGEGQGQGHRIHSAKTGSPLHVLFRYLLESFRNAVGYADCFLLVVGDINKGNSDCVMNSIEFNEHVLAHCINMPIETLPLVSSCCWYPFDRLAQLSRPGNKLFGLESKNDHGCRLRKSSMLN